MTSNKMRVKMKLLMIMCLVIVFNSNAAHAKTNLTASGAASSTNINISGVLVANGTCTFDQGGAQTIDFGKVLLISTGSNTVELTGDYQKTLSSNFTCSGDSEGLLQMKFTSSTGSYETYNNKKILGTDKGIVGIELLVDGTAQNMDEWFSVDKKSLPVLQAKLVQFSTANTNNVVSGDKFTASGTLVLAFN